ncbi:hypothetical protein HYPSUDRAFT_36647 [Hypholoma sublateritium FD-334 SS-4]|uniref:G-protein coupled receptors family 2 profile 2 domain-containing protein n=1 Tax=Hypholoma sublateritium (strain FD-334 SS-4) TaxID=945553 RepID=A0A0D2LFE3_HYPSF|nr:hypothetical protein HYPSUDRAFT_36647 [Hypholoma sublateritium FD-334 SS-4]
MPILLGLMERSIIPSSTLRIEPLGGQDAAPFRFVVIHDVIYCLNIILVLTVILTAWLAKLQRSSTWYGAASTVITSAVANMLLLGRQSGVSPSFGLCLTQAALIYSIVVLDSFYALTFILEAYVTIQVTLLAARAPSRYVTLLYHALPWTSFSGALVGIFIYGLNNDSTIQVSTTGMYCHMTSTAPGGIVAGVGIICMIGIATLEALIIMTLRRISGSWKALFRNDACIAPGSMIRVILFSIAPLLAIVVSAAQFAETTAKQNAYLEILLASSDFIVMHMQALIDERI